MTNSNNIESKPTDSMTPQALGAVMRPVQLKETRPKSITWHIIWDHELEGLTNISRPIVLGLSTTFLGALFGFTPDIFGLCTRLLSKQILTASDLFTCVASGCCATAAIIFGYFAIRGQVDAQKIKSGVRSREEEERGPIGL